MCLIFSSLLVNTYKFVCQEVGLSIYLSVWGRRSEGGGSCCCFLFHSTLPDNKKSRRPTTPWICMYSKRARSFNYLSDGGVERGWHKAPIYAGSIVLSLYLSVWSTNYASSVLLVHILSLSWNWRRRRGGLDFHQRPKCSPLTTHRHPQSPSSTFCLCCFVLLIWNSLPRSVRLR